MAEAFVHPHQGRSGKFICATNKPQHFQLLSDSRVPIGIAPVFLCSIKVEPG
jgi:hypothetical protein